MEELQEGAKALVFRQKLIQLADQLDFGRDAVKEYETDELAEDDDNANAKCLEKAEKVAKQKALKFKKAGHLHYKQGRRQRNQGYVVPHSHQISASSRGQTQQSPVFQFCGNTGGSIHSLMCQDLVLIVQKWVTSGLTVPSSVNRILWAYPLFVVLMLWVTVCHVVLMMYG